MNARCRCCDREARAALVGIATYAAAMLEQLRTGTPIDPERVLQTIESHASSVLLGKEARESAPTSMPVAAGGRRRPRGTQPQLGRVTRERAVEMLQDPGSRFVERMRVFDLLRLVPELGHDGARGLLRQVRIAEGRAVNSLVFPDEMLRLTRALTDLAARRRVVA